MNYIYDVLLNFHKAPYEFYEWNKSDFITHIRKIPIIKVKGNILYELYKYNVEFEKDFLNQIKNKCEVFTKKGIKTIKYAFVVSDSLSSLSLFLDNNGKTIKISKLLPDEDLDACDFSNCLISTKINYKRLFERKINEFRTRGYLELENKIYSNLKRIKDNKEEMQYLFYECFNIKKDDTKEMYEIFIEQIRLNPEKIVFKLNNIFNLTIR